MEGVTEMELFIGDEKVADLKTGGTLSEETYERTFYLPYAHFNADDVPEGLTDKDATLYIDGESVGGILRKDTNGEHEYVFEKKYTNEGQS